MVGTVPTEVKQLFSPHFFFNVTISQQVAVQFIQKTPNSSIISQEKKMHKETLLLLWVRAFPICLVLNKLYTRPRRTLVLC